MNRFMIGVAALVACAGTAFGQTTVYTTEAAFSANVQAGSYDEGFGSVAGGPVASLSFTGGMGPFAYTISVVEPALSPQLFNDPGLISTDNEGDQIRVDFTPPVTAIGGIFYGTDISFFTVPTDITLVLSDGTTETYTATGPTFRGFTSTMAIASLIVSENNQPGGAFAWPTIDRMIVGRKTGGTPSPACCVDFNGDTEVDFTDVEGFLAALAAMTAGSCAPGADFNGDTEFDFSDIESFIGVFNTALGTICMP